MKIVISGITGFIGKELSLSFRQKGYDVFRLSREDLSKETKHISHIISQADVIINLAGATILKRWTSAWKKEIYNSRIKTTQAIVEAMKELPESNRPKQFLSASAVGYYQQQGTHDEINFQPGTGFLADTCNQWEAAAKVSEAYGVRLKIMRFGVVLGNQGGAFPRMLKIFRYGLGGIIGTGKQGFPFIHIDDLVRAIHFLIEHQETLGAYNFVAPDKITNKHFTNVLGKTLHRATFFRVPTFALKVIYGEGAKVITEGPMIRPTRLLNSGFQFNYPNIDCTLSALYTMTKKEGNLTATP